MTKPHPTPTPTTEPKTRATPDKYTLAAKLARRIAALDTEEAKEIAEAPKSIQARYQKKRDAVTGGATAEVLELVNKMVRGPAPAIDVED
jgi:hypothetical protein